MSELDMSTDRGWYIIVELTRHLFKARKLEGGTNSELLIPRIPMLQISCSIQAASISCSWSVLPYYQSSPRTDTHAIRCLPSNKCFLSWTFICCIREVFVFADQSEFDSIKKFLDPGKTYKKHCLS